MKLGGISISFCSWPGNSSIWPDTTDDEVPTAEQRPAYGFKFAIRWGPAVIWIPRWWSKNWDHNHEDNAGQPVLFRWTLPVMVGPYLSIVIGKFGCYLGFKDAGDPKRNTLLLSAKLDVNRFWSDEKNG